MISIDLFQVTVAMAIKDMSAILVGDLRIKLAEQAVKTLVDDDRASLKASFML